MKSLFKIISEIKFVNRINIPMIIELCAKIEDFYADWNDTGDEHPNYTNYIQTLEKYIEFDDERDITSYMYEGYDLKWLDQNELDSLYRDLKQLIQKDQISEIKFVNRITPKMVSDMRERIFIEKKLSDLDIHKLTDIKYVNNGIYRFVNNYGNIEKHCAALTQDQLNDLYSRLKNVYNSLPDETNINEIKFVNHVTHKMVWELCKRIENYYGYQVPIPQWQAEYNDILDNYEISMEETYNISEDYLWKVPQDQLIPLWGELKKVEAQL